MSAYNFELHAENDECRALLRRQHETAISEGTIECAGCGLRRDIVTVAFRCLYCGLWWCFACGEKHFGKTHAEWIAQRRREKREALNEKLNHGGE